MVELQSKNGMFSRMGTINQVDNNLINSALLPPTYIARKSKRNDILNKMTEHEKWRRT
jgi:hypothetical protein